MFRVKVEASLEEYPSFASYREAFLYAHKLSKTLAEPLYPAASKSAFPLVSIYIGEYDYVNHKRPQCAAMFRNGARLVGKRADDHIDSAEWNDLTYEDRVGIRHELF